MPADGKVCTFDCIYCECGFNSQRILNRNAQQGMRWLWHRKKLKEMHEQNVHPDVLTFAGNGEPTAHPDFLRDYT